MLRLKFFQVYLMLQAQYINQLKCSLIWKQKMVQASMKVNGKKVISDLNYSSSLFANI